MSSGSNIYLDNGNLYKMKGNDDNEGNRIRNAFRLYISSLNYIYVYISILDMVHVHFHIAEISKI